MAEARSPRARGARDLRAKLTREELASLASDLQVDLGEIFEDTSHRLVRNVSYYASHEPIDPHSSLKLFRALAKDPLSDATLKLLDADDFASRLVLYSLDRRLRQEKLRGSDPRTLLRKCQVIRSFASKAANTEASTIRRGRPADFQLHVVLQDIVRGATILRADLRLPQEDRERNKVGNTFPLFEFARSILSIGLSKAETVVAQEKLPKSSWRSLIRRTDDSHRSLVRALAKAKVAVSHNTTFSFLGE